MANSIRVSKVVIRRTTIAYMLTIGIMIIFLWVFLISSNNVPELETEPASILFHITAEELTAILLVISGVIMWKQKKWSLRLSLISLGMLLYSIVNSSGYYVQYFQLPFVVMFGILFVMTLTIIILLAFNYQPGS